MRQRQKKLCQFVDQIIVINGVFRISSSLISWKKRKNYVTCGDLDFLFSFFLSYFQSIITIFLNIT